jgi:hypothetical protein
MVMLIIGAMAAGVALAASVRPNIKLQSENEMKPLVTIKPTALNAPAFNIMTVAQLKADTTVKKLEVGIRAAAPISGALKAVKVVAMDPSLNYSLGKGVVLDAAHMWDEKTYSWLRLHGVQLDEGLRKNIVAGNNTFVRQWIPPKTATGYQGIVAGFYHLPAGKHTYILTIGTTANPKYMGVTIQGNPPVFLPPAYLQQGPGFWEVRTGFVGDFGSSLELNVAFWYNQSGSTGYIETMFNHLQLAVVD